MAGSISIGSIYATFFAKNARFVAALKQNGEALRRQQRAVNALKRDVRAFNREARTMANRFAVLSTVALGAAVRSFTRFGETMAQVRGITSATGDQFQILRRQALDLGRATRFSTTQAAEGQLFLARAGFEVGQIYAALPGTLQLAQAAAIEVGQAADFVSNALAAFRESADQTTRFVDVMAKTTTSANTDMVQLADALKLVAPVAKSLNVSVETTAAAIGVLSDAGLQATLAGTGLRKVLFDLQSPTTKTQDILKSLGLTVQAVSIEQHGLVEVLRRLTEAGISATQVIDVFGARGAPAFLNLAAAIPRIEELNQSLLDAAGTAAELARIQDDTLGGAFKRLVSAAEGFGIALTTTSGLGKGLQANLDSVAAAINRLTDNLAAHVDQIVHVAALITGLFIARSGLGRAITGIAVNLTKATVALLSLRGGVAATARSFVSFYTLPSRALARLRSGIETTAIRFLLLRDSARRTASAIRVFMRAPILSLRLLRGEATLAGVALRTTGVVARTTFAIGMTAAAGAMRLFARVTRGALGLLRAFAPILVIEGIIQLIKYLVNLRAEVAKIGVSFKNAGLVAGVDFVETLAKGLLRVPALLGAVFTGAFAAVREIVVSNALAIRAAILAAAPGGESPAEAYAREIQGAFKHAGTAFTQGYNTFYADASALIEQLNFSDTLLRGLGLSDAQLAKAREANAKAFAKTKRDLLALFTPGAAAGEGVALPFLPGDKAGDGENAAVPAATEAVPNAALERQRTFFRELQEQARQRNELVQHGVALLGLEGEALVRRQAQLEVLNRVKARELELRQQLTAAGRAYGAAVAEGNNAVIVSAEQQVNTARALLVAFEQQKQGLDQIIASYERAAVAGQKLELIKSLFTQTLPPLERYNAQLKILGELLHKAAIDHKRYTELVKRAQNQLDEASNKTNDAARSLGFTFASAFEQAVVEGKNLRSVLRGVLQDIARIALRKAIVEPLGTKLGGFFSTLLPFGGAKARGGPVLLGHAYLVGEHGRELHVPRAPGEIISNDVLRRLVSGRGTGRAMVVSPTVNVPVAAQPGESPEAQGEAAARAVERTLVQVVEKVMHDHARQGGLFRPA